ncbi:MAG: glycoside hydrolase family 3 C-terminal domain-containing protein [Labilibaculum sp.]|nr:glycoside hydrolase family 3 C-terminal domain-containing protein [Labilibaculum sp.]MBI9057341.1 glycoside hydrolase family 3 C-terminal domain-containing protein [Labilibaculum sp.]
MKFNTYLFLLFGFVLSCTNVQAQEVDKSYLDTDLSMEDRVDLLVDQMTLKEKIAQLTDESKAVPRLDIPEYGWWNEALHGVAYSGRATVFPQPIGLASSWNKDLIYDIAVAVSDEARAKHHNFVRNGKRNNFQGLTFWAPNINIFRDPRWGRGIETYGEDPFLTGRLGVAYVKGLQGEDEKYLKLVATPKHYAVHSGPEPERHRFNATCSDKDLYETYLPHFKEAIQEGGAYSIMSAYNRFNGESCSGHKRLLTEILRDEWGFDGYVVSDCNAIRDIFLHHKIVDSKEEAAVVGITSGCDLNCGDYYKTLNSAHKQGLISEEEIDIAVKRVLLARFKLGMFDADEIVPYAQIPMSVVNSEENQKLAIKSACESMVLLKNEKNLLPLSEDIKTIGVMGPNANDLEVLLGNYNGLPFEASTPLEGIKKYAPKGCNVLYSLGADWAEGVNVVETLPKGLLFTKENGILKEGLWGEYFSNTKLEGKPAAKHFDKHLAFDWRDGAPLANFPDDNFSIRWQGILKVKESGEYRLGSEAHHEFRIFIDDSLHVKHAEFYHQNTKKVASVKLEAGKEYNIRIEFVAKTGDANFRLVWVPNNRKLVENALEVAEKSDVVVMCMGLSPRLEGEEIRGLKIDGFYGGDRTDIVLPENQQELIKAVAKTGKPIVLVLLNGSALAINWSDKNIPAILEAWYPGQAAGDAIGKTLFGENNPSGRLPVTFYKSVNDLPDFSDYSMKNRTYRYFEGEALYPFGYGLSYSNFKYSNLKIAKKSKLGDSVTLEVDIRNTSELEGEEVVQVYISNKIKDLKIDLPITSLKSFSKLKINSRETKTVTFELKPEYFSYVDKLGKTVLSEGDFEVFVGGVLPGYKSATTEGLSAKIHIEK